MPSLGPQRVMTAYINKPRPRGQKLYAARLLLSHTPPRQGEKKTENAARVPLLQVKNAHVHKLFIYKNTQFHHAAATTSLFPTFYIPAATHFEGEILYS
jgi:hypothetical protein